MKQKIEKIKAVASSEQTKQAVAAMKPEKNIWGILGVVLFFIVPEIIGFIYGEQITAYANASLQADPGALEYYYEALLFLFEGGGSWINLAIGVALLVWLFF
jgi:hypothetical protein